MEETKLTKGPRVIKITSIAVAVISILSVWIYGFFYTNYYTSNLKWLYSIIFLIIAVVALCGLVVSVIAIFKIPKPQKYIHIACSLINLGIVFLELISVFLLNSLH